MQRVYVPKKVEVPVVPAPKPTPLPTIRISAMEAPITNHVGPIVTEYSTPASKQDETPKIVAKVEKEKRVKRNSKYTQPKWCPHGLNKTQRHKLQGARHKQQKREKLGMMGNEISNVTHVEIPSKDQDTNAATV